MGVRVDEWERRGMTQDRAVPQNASGVVHLGPTIVTWITPKRGTSEERKARLGSRNDRKRINTAISTETGLPVRTRKERSRVLPGLTVRLMRTNLPTDWTGTARLMRTNLPTD